MVHGCLAKPFDHRQLSSVDRRSTADDGDLPAQLFWPDALDWNVNALFTEEDRRILAKKMRTLRVVSLEEGCGRMKNRLATLEDGTRVCCRYRDNGNQLRGDVYAYHFNRLLGMWNVPPTVAVQVDLSVSSRQWRDVRHTAMNAGWKNGDAIVVSQFVEELKEEYFPSALKNISFLPLTAVSVSNLSSIDVKQLIEWTDMILFDFISGHTDRLFNALLNSKWNDHMMEMPVHNLKKTVPSSDLVLLDNESGFEFGYVVAEQTGEYRKLQTNFLERICVFRASTITALMKLGSSQNTPPSVVLENYIRHTDLQSYSALRVWKTQSQSEFDARVRETLSRVHECARIVNR